MAEGPNKAVILYVVLISIHTQVMRLGKPTNYQQSYPQLPPSLQLSVLCKRRPLFKAPDKGQGSGRRRARETPRLVWVPILLRWLHTNPGNDEGGNVICVQ